MMLDLVMGVAQNADRDGGPSGNAFKTIVKNNLYYWLRKFPWDEMPNVSELILEKENIIKAIQTGIRFKSTYYISVHLLYVATDLMLHVGTRYQWVRLIEQTLERCPADAENLRRRLNLCQAKHMFLDEQYEALSGRLKLLAQQAKEGQDADLIWEIMYLYGMVECHLHDFQAAQACVDNVSSILENFTLLNPHLCKGKMAKLGGRIALAKQDFEMAFYYLELALHHLQKGKADYYLALALSLSGLYYEQQGNYDAALSALNRSASLIPDGFSFELRSKLQTSIARIYLLKKQFNLAQNILEDLDFGMMRVLGCQHLHLEAILLLSEVMRMKGANDQADLILENAESLRSELADSDE